MRNNKCSHDFAVPLVWQPDDRNIGNSGMGEETILDFKRVDVLPTFDDKVFDATSDFDIAFRIYGCFITGLSHSTQQLWSSKTQEVTLHEHC